MSPYIRMHDDVLRPLVDGARRVDRRELRRLPDEQRRRSGRARSCGAVGLPMYAVTASMPWRSSTPCEQLLAARERLVPGRPRATCRRRGPSARAGGRGRGAGGRASCPSGRGSPSTHTSSRSARISVDVLVLDVDLEAAHRLAQRTRDEMSLHQSSISHHPALSPEWTAQAADTGARHRAAGLCRRAEGGASPTKPPHDASAASEEDREEAMRSLRRAGAEER